MKQDLGDRMKAYEGHESNRRFMPFIPILARLDGKAFHTFCRGTWLQRTRTLRPFSSDEMEKLPPQHAARLNPDLVVERWQVQSVEMPPFTRVTNREGVIFRGEDPLTKEEV